MKMEKEFNYIIKGSSEKAQQIATAIQTKILEIEPNAVEVIWENDRAAGLSSHAIFSS